MIGNPNLDRRIRRASDVFKFLTLAVFFLGNYSLMRPSNCGTQAVLLYWVGLATLCLQWLSTIEFLVVCLAVIFFLPFFLVMARRVNRVDPEVKGITKDAAAALPVRVFLAVAEEGEECSTATLVNPQLIVKVKAEDNLAAQGAKPSRRRWSRLWRQPSSTEVATAPTSAAVEPGALLPLPAGAEYVSLPPSQSSCAICLTGELLIPSSPTAVARRLTMSGDWVQSTRRRRRRARRAPASGSPSCSTSCRAATCSTRSAWSTGSSSRAGARCARGRCRTSRRRCERRAGRGGSG